MNDLQQARITVLEWLAESDLFPWRESYAGDFGVVFASGERGKRDVRCLIETDQSVLRQDFQQRAHRLAVWRDAAKGERWFVVFAPPNRLHTEMVPMARFDQIIQWPRQRHLVSRWNDATT